MKNQTLPRADQFNLNIPRYVDTFEEEEEIDIDAVGERWVGYWRASADDAEPSNSLGAGAIDMNQLTIRGFDDELTNRIRQLASREGSSLNRAVLRLLREGVGLEDRKGGDIVGSSLDHLIGTWTCEEAAEMARALEDLSHVDEAMWK